MIVNIVDTKGDFKKSFDNNEDPKTIDDVLDSIVNIQSGIGKNIQVILRDLRWSVRDLKLFVPYGVLDNELNELINGEVLRLEVSDM